MEKPDKIKAAKLLSRQLNKLQNLKALSPEDSAFIEWKCDVSMILKKSFGNDTEFKSISYTPVVRPTRSGWVWGNSSDMALSSVTGEQERKKRAFRRGLVHAEAYLKSKIHEVEIYWSEQASPTVASPKENLMTIFDRFHAVVHQLKERRSTCKPLVMDNEYDVQYLLQGLLSLFFDDVRREEWTPSSGGSCKRLDFLIHKDGTIIETKKTRKGLADKELSEQIAVDVHSYKKHPDAKRLIFFIYDPDEFIRNPAGLENEFTTNTGMPVECFVRPTK